MADMPTRTPESGPLQAPPRTGPDVPRQPARPAQGLAVHAVGLTKRFGTRTALQDVDLEIHRGSVVGLLGPNGAGKTTTIRLLTTVLTPTGGTFEVAGVRSDDPIGIRRRVGVLAESAGYPGQATGTEYLRYAARLQGSSRPDAAARAERMLAEVGLADRAGSRISSYSRGMRQRLGIARALLHDPEVVFLDEPALGLDPVGQRQVLQMVRDVARRRGATVVLSTHTLSEVEQVCSSVVILLRGRVVAAGSVADVTRSVASIRTGHLQVPPDRTALARATLERIPGLQVEVDEARADVLLLRQTTASGEDRPADRGATDALNAALAAVLATGTPVLSFQLDAARLNDAFLAMTSGADR